MDKKRTMNVKKKQILELLFDLLPYVFWKEKTGRYLGGNLNQAKNLGFKSPDEFIGKTIYELLDDKDSAKRIDDNDNTVMHQGITLIEEEKMVTQYGEKVFSSQKSPIYDKQNNIIGMIGFSMDVTEVKQREERARKERDQLEAIAVEKEAERLRTENESKRQKLKIQEQFVKTANQVAHDIRSPLASLLMIVNACKEIPERERIALRSASTRINDIANNLLSHYRMDNPEMSSELKERTPILLSATLLQLLTEKKFQYGDRIHFECHFETGSQFAFILVEDSAFKRMLSNLINNAVEACSGLEKAIVTIGLEIDKGDCLVVVSDNGKGMSQALIDKIMNNMAVTVGKVNGNGIGLTQARETLIRNEGRLCIRSEKGQGSDFQLIFPLIKAPDWIAEQIVLDGQGRAVILDDDSSIHGAWDSRLESIVGQLPNIRVSHFEKGYEALAFLKTLNQLEKQSTLLLTDYELLNEDINGLDVVEQVGIQSAIVVTSHYENPEIQQRAFNIGAKILPKQLASEIPIEIMDTGTEIKGDESCEAIHAILVDDDETYINNVLLYQFDEEDRILHFKSPDALTEYLELHPSLPRDTKICMDNQFDKSAIQGKDFVKILHDLGFTQLYLISGRRFSSNELPPYLKVLDKTEIGKIKDW